MVYVVDDDLSVGRSLGRLLGSLEIANRIYVSGAELLADPDRGRSHCLLIDVRIAAIEAAVGREPSRAGF